MVSHGQGRALNSVTIRLVEAIPSLACCLIHAEVDYCISGMGREGTADVSSRRGVHLDGASLDWMEQLAG